MFYFQKPELKEHCRNHSRFPRLDQVKWTRILYVFKLSIVKLHGEEKRIINVSESFLNYTLPIPSKRNLKDDDGKRKRLTVQYLQEKKGR